MRLALLTDRPQSSYGAEHNLLTLGALARELDHTVTATSIEPGVFLDAAAARGFDTLLVPLPEPLTPITRGGLRPTPRTLIGMARFGHRIHQAMRRAEIDVVIVSSARAAAMNWSSRLRRPHMIWYSQMRTAPSAGAAAAALGAHRIAVIAPGVEDSIPRPLRRLLRNRVTTLPPCRDLDAFTVPERRVRQVGDPLRVISVGKITPRKRTHDLVDAAAEARRAGADVALTIVGDASGPADEAYLRDARQRAAHQRVPTDWLGWQDDVVGHLHHADLFALVSEREGLPGAAVEAMATGLPAVVSDTGPIAGLIRSADCGAVAPVGDVACIAHHLCALADDPDETRRQGARAAAAAQDFTPARTSEALGAILAEMAPAPADPTGSGSLS